MPDVESFWHSLEEAYQAILSAPSFDAWIKTTRPLKLDNNQLWLEVPSAVHRDYWEKNLSAKIVKTGFKLTGAE
ncbi:DnaA N-terminal domain-containing protein, partial [Enterococcus faecium]|uniref:DnaA N-terminal domain-containing protein n=1 Tax=Enterococcus faecium TaxID=1352 RepID=UPI0030C87F76